MPITLDGTNGITTPTYGGADTSEYLVPVTAFKNRIINGAMVIDQRNAGASISTPNGYTLDRWNFAPSVTGKVTAQQNQGSVTPPVGFTNYLGFTSSSAYSVGAGDYFFLYQPIEGFNIADLNWGSANAKTVTLSFQVYSSLTGTFGGALRNGSNNRSYPFTYTISSANTWTAISLTIAGDTTGTWNTTNGTGLQVQFGLGAGSTYSGTAGSWAGANYVTATGGVSVVGTNGATFYITGVQLEVGSTATSFDYRPYQTELNLCYRYYFKYAMRFGVNGFNENTGGFLGSFAFPTMRAAPTISTDAGATYQIRYAGSVVNCSSVTGDSTTVNSCRIVGNTSGLTAGQGSALIATADTFLAVSAEL